jgi:hypothetical protein
MKAVCVFMTVVTLVLACAVWLPSGSASGQRAGPMRVDGRSADPLGNLLNYPPGEFYQAQNEEMGAHLETANLVHAYAKTNGEKDRDTIKSQLRKALEKEFELKQRRRGLELDWVDSHMKRARASLEKRSAERQTIIEKQFDHLLIEADGLGWNEPSGMVGAKETEGSPIRQATPVDPR